MNDHTSHLKQAFDRSVPVVHGEVPEMIARNMNLADGPEFHAQTWGFNIRAGLAHENSHVLLAALQYAHPELMQGKAYQGDFESESYAIPVQNIIVGSYAAKAQDFFNDRDRFIDDVISTSRRYFFQENLNRVFAWIVADARGISTAEVKKEMHYEWWALQSQASCADPLVMRGGSSEEKDVVRIVSSKYGDFTMAGPEATTLYGETIKPDTVDFQPKISSADPLTPYTVPTRAEAGRIYDALLPAIHLIQKKIYDYRAAYGGAVIDFGTGRDYTDASSGYEYRHRPVDAPRHDGEEFAVFSRISLKEVVESLRPAQPIRQHAVRSTRSAGIENPR